MMTASRSSGDSPIAASLRVSSLTLRPASIRIRVFEVARNAAFPELPLARTEKRTVTIPSGSVLAGHAARHNDLAEKPPKVTQSVTANYDAIFFLITSTSSCTAPELFFSAALSSSVNLIS